MSMSFKSLAAAMIFLPVSLSFAGGIELAQPTNSMLDKTVSVPAFHRIVANGYFNLVIKPKSGQASVSTVSYEHAPITVNVHDHTLYLTSSTVIQPDVKGHPAVTVRLPSLSSLKVDTSVNVNAYRIPTKGLKLKTDGYGEINIRQTPRIKAISQSGNNLLHVTGLNASTLSLKMHGFGKTELQGKVNHLYARVAGESTLRARKLNAKHVTIQTRYNASAYITPSQTLRAFAKGSGEIYYYKHLTDLTRYTVASGNSLQMKW